MLMNNKSKKLGSNLLDYQMSLKNTKFSFNPSPEFLHSSKAFRHQPFGTARCPDLV